MVLSTSGSLGQSFKYCGSGVEPVSCYLEGRWFSSPGLHVKVSLGKILNLKLCMNVCMNHCK